MLPPRWYGDAILPQGQTPGCNGTRKSRNTRRHAAVSETKRKRTGVQGPGHFSRSVGWGREAKGAHSAALEVNKSGPELRAGRACETSARTEANPERLCSPQISKWPRGQLCVT